VTSLQDIGCDWLHGIQNFRETYPGSLPGWGFLLLPPGIGLACFFVPLNLENPVITTILGVTHLQKSWINPFFHRLQTADESKDYPLNSVASLRGSGISGNVGSGEILPSNLVGCVAAQVDRSPSPGSKNAITHHLAVNSRKRIAIVETTFQFPIKKGRSALTPTSIHH
jgi:hypothetical protein